MILEVLQKSKGTLQGLDEIWTTPILTPLAGGQEIALRVRRTQKVPDLLDIRTSGTLPKSNLRLCRRGCLFFFSSSIHRVQASFQSTVTCSLLSRPIAVAMDKRPRRRPRDDDESFLRFWNDGKPVPSGRSGDEDASKENVAPAAGAGNGAASASREAERVERPHSWRRLRSRVSVPYRPLRVGRPPLQASVDNSAAAAAATGPSVKEVHTPERRSTPFRRPGAPLPARIRSAVRRAVRRQRLRERVSSRPSAFVLPSWSPRRSRRACAASRGLDPRRASSGERFRSPGGVHG